MLCRRLAGRIVALLAAGGVVACSEDAPVAPGAGGTASGRQHAAASLDPVSGHGAEVPLAYYELSLAFTKQTLGFSPPVQARAYAYMGLALYEALVSGMPGYRSIAKQLNGIGPLPEPAGIPYHWPLVANAALAEVMRGLWGGKTSRAPANIADLDAIEAAFVARYAEIPPGLAQQSERFGREVGAAVFATSIDDGGHEGYAVAYANNFPPYTPPVGPGLWVPPTGQKALLPYWGTAVQTMVLSSATECDQGGPPAYSTQSGSPFRLEAEEVYQAVKNLTSEQRTIALYWADGPTTISGPGHSIAIADEILVQTGADLGVVAETYARVGLAVADAITALWWAKYHYNQVPLQPASPGHVHPERHRSGLRDGAADPAIPRIRVGALDAVSGCGDIARVSVRE